MVQYPVDGDRHYLKYRKDIFDNPADANKVQGQDRARSSRVPKTWEEYNEVAAYFSGWDWAGDGKPHFGTAEVTKRDDLMFSAFISRAAAYAKNPNVKGGFFFDLATMEPQINNPGFVRGWKCSSRPRQFPPGGDNFGLGDEIFSFGGGQTLMSYSWDDAFIQAMEQAARSATRSRRRRCRAPGGVEPGDQEMGPFRRRRMPALHHLGLDLGGGEGVEEQGHGLRLSVLLQQRSQRGIWTCRSAGSASIRIARPHFDPTFWDRQARLGKAVATTYVEDAVRNGQQQQSRLRPARARRQPVHDVDGGRGLGGDGGAEDAAAGARRRGRANGGDIVDRIGKDKVRDAYEVVALEDKKPPVQTSIDDAARPRVDGCS